MQLHIVSPAVETGPRSIMIDQGSVPYCARTATRTHIGSLLKIVPFELQGFIKKSIEVCQKALTIPL
jgi:hypothetical protein